MKTCYACKHLKFDGYAYDSGENWWMECERGHWGDSVSVMGLCSHHVSRFEREDIHTHIVKAETCPDFDPEPFA